MTKRSFRLMQYALTLITFLAVCFSFYFQYGMGLMPCPLCLMQRFCACALLMVCLISLCLRNLNKAKYSILFQALFAALGLFFASRQLWLQSIAVPEVSTCLPGIEMLIRYFPWRDIAHLFLWGSNSCGEAAWYGLGLSMPAWSAIYFGFILLFSGVLFCRLMLTPIVSQPN